MLLVDDLVNCKRRVAFAVPDSGRTLWWSMHILYLQCYTSQCLLLRGSAACGYGDLLTGVHVAKYPLSNTLWLESKLSQINDLCIRAYVAILQQKRPEHELRSQLTFLERSTSGLVFKPGWQSDSKRAVNTA